MTTVVTIVVLVFYKSEISSIEGGSSLRSWQLTHELSSIQSGVINIDDDLTYLYGQLPDRIRAAAVSVMAKKMRDVLYNTSRAILNLLGIGLT